MKISSINHNQYALEKINPNRFVYHLSYKKNRNKIENKSIIAMLKNKEDKRGVLFAHNDELLTTAWYNINSDLLELNLNNHLNDFIEYYNEKDWHRIIINNKYDIWRIDTKKAKKNWYIDHVGLNDFYSEGQKKDLYIKCYGNIPIDAITLCCLDIELKGKVQKKSSYKSTTYYNPIIPRIDFVDKYNQNPEDEFYTFCEFAERLVRKFDKKIKISF